VEAMTLGDRVVVLRQGVVQQIDRPQMLYERPVNRFVAGFIGWPPMNFLDGQLVRREGRLGFAAQELFLPLPIDRAVNGAPAVALGIRPEDVLLADSEDRNAAGLEMEVTLVESLGGSSLVVLERNGCQVTAHTGGSVTIINGQKVRVELNMQRSHLFDAATGLALNTG